MPVISLSSISGQSDQGTQMVASATTTSQSPVRSTPRGGSGSAAWAPSSLDGSKRYLTVGGISSTLSDNTLFTLMQLGNQTRAKMNVRENEDEKALLITMVARKSAASKNAYLAGQRKVKPVFDRVDNE
jgi:hypothetical protein